MSLAGLLGILDDDPQFRAVVARAAAGPESASTGPASTGPAGIDLVAPPALRPVLAAALAWGGRRRARTSRRQEPDAKGQRASGFVLAVTATAREAEDLAAGLGSFLPPDSVASFPGWETLPHERLSPRSDTVGQRLAVLRRLAHPAPPGEPNGPLTVVVAPVRSLLQPIVAGLGDLEPVTLRPGQACELDDLLTRLVEIGYTRADMVGSRGEIAVRGGIVDVFPPTEEHPLRIEFFGDTIEEIRYFKVADQRSIGPAERGLWAPPCRELLLTPAVRDRAKELADIHPALAETLGKLAEGIAVEGMEAFAPVLAERMELLVDYVPAGGLVLACDPERVRTRAEELARTSQEFLEASWVNAAAGGRRRSISARRLSSRSSGYAPRRPRSACRGGRSRRSGSPGRTSRSLAPAQLRQLSRTGRVNPVRSGSMPRWRRRTAVTPAGCSPMCAAGWPTAGGSCWLPRATGRPSGWPRCCVARTSARACRMSPIRRRPASPM